MSISFPTNPTNGQIYQNWVWSSATSTWNAVAPGLTLQMRKQIFTASGTYTPSPGMFQADVEVVGGGGGGGGSNGFPSSSGGWVSCGGAAGGYSRRLLTAAQIGSSQTVTLGAGGTSTATTAGTTGGNSSFGSLVTANGGAGGGTGVAQNPVALGGAAGVGDIALPGENGGPGSAVGASSAAGGWGGSGLYGSGGIGVNYYTPAGPGANARGYGAGGGGCLVTQSYGASAAGGNGAPGLCIVTEYCWITQAAVAAQAASGARVLMLSQTVSTPVATVAFTTGLDDTTIDEFVFELVNITLSAVGTYLGLRYSNNYGSTWDTANNYVSASYAIVSDNTFINSSGGAAYGTLAPTSGVSGSYPLSGRVRLWTPWSTTLRRMALVDMGSSVATGYARNIGNVAYTPTPSSSSVINGVQFINATAVNFTGGTFKLYKVVR